MQRGTGEAGELCHLRGRPLRSLRAARRQPPNGMSSWRSSGGLEITCAGMHVIRCKARGGVRNKTHKPICRTGFDRPGVLTLVSPGANTLFEHVQRGWEPARTRSARCRRCHPSGRSAEIAIPMALAVIARVTRGRLILPFGARWTFVGDQEEHALLQPPRAVAIRMRQGVSSPWTQPWVRSDVLGRTTCLLPGAFFKVIDRFGARRETAFGQRTGILHRCTCIGTGHLERGAKLCSATTRVRKTRTASANVRSSLSTRRGGPGLEPVRSREREPASWLPAWYPEICLRSLVPQTAGWKRIPCEFKERSTHMQFLIQALHDQKQDCTHEANDRDNATYQMLTLEKARLGDRVFRRCRLGGNP
jgi:hypothetical protein